MHYWNTKPEARKDNLLMLCNHRSGVQKKSHHEVLSWIGSPLYV